MDRLDEMSLSSIALNLFDRGTEVRVSMDLLALKLEEKYHITDIVVTSFSREYMSNSRTYIRIICEKCPRRGISHAG